MKSRRSYRRLMSLPVWALFDRQKLVATVRAEDASEARQLFKDEGMKGTWLRKLSSR